MNFFHYKDVNDPSSHEELVRIVKDLQGHGKEVQGIIDDIVKGMEFDKFRYHRNSGNPKRDKEFEQRIERYRNVKDLLRELLFYNFD